LRSAACAARAGAPRCSTRSSAMAYGSSLRSTRSGLYLDTLVASCPASDRWFSGEPVDGVQHHAGRGLAHAEALLEPLEQLVQVADGPGPDPDLVVEAAGDVHGVDHLGVVAEGLVDPRPRRAGQQLEVHQGVDRAAHRLAV